MLVVQRNQVTCEAYAPLDTMYQYLKIFQAMQKRSQ